ncbi:MAG: hypothetical protein N0C84_00510 [Candidatus Thiodiazotropha taylori]|uniref:Uncharacterized protein n=1 Tax=Candidatus Thiodiazotropha taylori TaxID=2792791 RepID=A0A9E4K8G5_9GAMM|nr:hypothetical protein [Candidatus Thiodiazotropha taylori]MCW4254926.1 hypothetical protein [Candidatus Thiodiazotropha taylori]
MINNFLKILIGSSLISSASFAGGLDVDPSTGLSDLGNTVVLESVSNYDDWQWCFVDDVEINGDTITGDFFMGHNWDTLELKADDGTVATMDLGTIDAKNGNVFHHDGGINGWGPRYGDGFINYNPSGTNDSWKFTLVNPDLDDTKKWNFYVSNSQGGGEKNVLCGGEIKAPEKMCSFTATDITTEMEWVNYDTAKYQKRVTVDFKLAGYKEYFMYITSEVNPKVTATTHQPYGFKVTKEITEITWELEATGDDLVFQVTDNLDAEEHLVMSTLTLDCKD